MAVAASSSSSSVQQPAVVLVVLLVGFMFLAVIQLPGVGATVYTVGGSTQWNFPPPTAANPLTWYNDVWAANITFKAGDVLGK
jgi:hypothetical protein